ncbi:protein kinase [Streptomyces sp. NPDC015032]|uniref:protein kinase domain-containing protein n=1 Tax=Streptomyces sp. NPDC015032 TaxID=3364937 RepID=UPI0036F82069
MWGRGTLIGGRYVLVGRLGGGAMGEVWRAEDQVLERQVAVKILHPSRLDDDSFLLRFRKEAKILASIHHPGVVGVHDYGEQAFPERGGADDAVTRAAYIVMGLVEGKTLEEARRESGLLPAARVLELVAQVLDALHAVHRLGIVHRDIKPSNLMLRGDGRVAVTDFGIARTEAGTRMTDTHRAVGTPLYMAPEHARGLPVVPASDLYSTGVVCYELLTGVPPFTGGSAVEVALKHISEPLPDLPDDVPEAIRVFVAKALAKDPEDRYVNAAVMAAAARRAAAGGFPGSSSVPAGPSGVGDGPVPDLTPGPDTTKGPNPVPGPERGPGTGTDPVVAANTESEPAKRGARSRRRPPLILLTAVFVPAATATTLYVAPPLWSSDDDGKSVTTPTSSPRGTAPDSEASGDAPSAAGSGSDAPAADTGAGNDAGGGKANKLGSGWEDRGVIQPKEFPPTNHFWMVDIDKDHMAEFVTVDKDQHFQFLWNYGPSGAGWKPFAPGKNSYKPPAGAVGNTLRFGDIDGDGFPDCMIVDLTGRLIVHTWKKENPSGARMCMNTYTGVSDVFSAGSTGNRLSIDTATRIRFADVTGGGRDDYLLIEPDSRTKAWYNRDFQSKDGREYLDWAAPDEISGSAAEAKEIRYADINGDGRADRILVTAKGGARAWINEGAKGAGGKFRDIGRIAGDADVPQKDVQFADIDGDGKADFLRIGWTGVTHAWLNKLKPEYFETFHP